MTAISSARSNATEGGPGLDDATLGLVAGTLYALTADPAELPASTGIAAAGVADRALQAAVQQQPSSSSNASGSSLATAPTVFPLVIGNTVLDALVNIQVAATPGGSSSDSGSSSSSDAAVGSAVPADVSAALVSTMSALTTASLRASAPMGAVGSNASAAAVAAAAPRTMTGGSPDAFGASSYCGQSLSVTVTRFATLSQAVASVAVAEPEAPCIPDAPEDAAAMPTALPSQLPPAVSIPSRSLIAAAGNSSTGAVDIAVIQWGSSPYPEQDGWAGAPPSLSPASLASHVLTVVLKTPAGSRAARLPHCPPAVRLGECGWHCRGVSVDLDSPPPPLPCPALPVHPQVTLPLVDPTAVDPASPGGNTSIRAAQAAPAVFVIPVPSQAALASGAVTANTSLGVWRVGDSAPLVLLNATVSAINATPVLLPVLDDAHSNLPFRRARALGGVDDLESDAVTAPMQGVAAWVADAVARCLGVAADAEHWVTPQLHRSAAQWLAEFALPGSAAAAAESGDGGDVGSVEWYWQWSGALTAGGGVDALSPAQRLAADLLRTFIFLTTPHELSRAASDEASGLRSRRLSPHQPRRASGAQFTALAYAAVVAIPCGPPAGLQHITIGGSSYDGINVTYTCPTILAVPSCGAWNPIAARWDAGGCVVVSVTPQGVKCSCSRLTYASFATRFSNVAAQQRGVFASAALLGDSSVLARYPTIFIIVGCLAVRCWAWPRCHTHLHAPHRCRYVAAAGNLPLVCCLWPSRRLPRPRRFLPGTVGRRRGKGGKEGRPRRTVTRVNGLWPHSDPFHLVSVQVTFMRKVAEARGVPFSLDRTMDREAAAAASEGKALPDSHVTMRQQAVVQRDRLRTSTEDVFRAHVGGQQSGAGSAAGSSDAVAIPAALLSPESTRALAEVLANCRASRQRNDPCMTALYLKLCEHAEGVSVDARHFLGSDAAIAHQMATLERLDCGADAALSDASSKVVEVVNEAGEGPAAAASVDLDQLWSQSEGALGSLEQPSSANCCLRCCVLHRFLESLWLTKVRFSHPYLSVCTRFDPWSPRTARATALAAALFASLFICAFFYAYTNGTPGRSLPPLSLSQQVREGGQPVPPPPSLATACLLPSSAQILLSLLTNAFLIPLSLFLVDPWLSAGGRAEFKWRYQQLWVEILRRRGAEKRFCSGLGVAPAAWDAFDGFEDSADGAEMERLKQLVPRG